MHDEQGRSTAVPGMQKTARSSVLCGIIMLGAWVLPMLALPLGIAGLTIGIFGWSSSRRDLARAGLFLNVLGLGLAGINMFLAVYLTATGKLEPLFTLR
ncbi:MAG: hypothetical protein GX890_05660 [Firmicutes bacterium]|nr:hypothetical protein [Bacillota bacterium]HPU02080.1 hypothetical protein [Bacillota bacterium]